MLNWSLKRVDFTGDIGSLDVTKTRNQTSGEIHETPQIHL